MKITFVIPSRNNLEFVQLAYASIRRLDTKHEVLILDDASTDGTSEWISNQNDSDLITYRNPGPDRIGIVGMFDKGIEMARTEIIMAFHADMVVCKDFDTNILKHLQKGVVVSATRVEPPLHPQGPEKITRNFGIEAEEFDMDVWWNLSEGLKTQDKITQGIFAPWCMYREDFLKVGGHDSLYAPQSKEDSSLFNRFVLSKYRVVQSWDALVYHFTSRGSRFNKHAGGAAGVNSQEWIGTTTRNERNFFRMWGQPILHDELMMPIILPKYDVGFNVKGKCSVDLLRILEPMCSTILVEDPTQEIINEYIYNEQPNTLVDLTKKIKVGPFETLTNGVIVDIEVQGLSQESINILQYLGHHLSTSIHEATSGDKTKVISIGPLTFHRNDLATYEHNLVHSQNQYFTATYLS